MNKIKYIVIGMLFSCGPFLLSTSSMNGSKKTFDKQYSGTLKTYARHKDDPYIIGNIVINPGNMQSMIGYEKPEQLSQLDLTSDEEGLKEIKLSHDPKGRNAEIIIDLEGITELYAPHPDVTWIYKKKVNERAVPKSYIEIEVLDKESKQKRFFLVSTKLNLHLDVFVLDPKDTQKKHYIKEMTMKEVPLRAIEKLTIQEMPQELFGQGAKINESKQNEL